jgi:hypothetical protein
MKLFAFGCPLASAGLWPARPSLLSRDFTAGLFDSLPDFDDAIMSYDALSEERLEQVFCKLGHVASRHNVEDVMLSLKHKHFDIPGDHFLGEESLHDSLSVMRPLNTSLLEFATPVSFTLVDGLWQPYEWSVNSSEAASNFEMLQGNEGFLQNIKDVLTSEQLDGLFGFHLQHRAAWEDAAGTMETPGDHEHELHIRPVGEEIEFPVDESPRDASGVDHEHKINPHSEAKNVEFPGDASADTRTVAWPLSTDRKGKQRGCGSHSIACSRHRKCLSHSK